MAPLLPLALVSQLLVASEPLPPLAVSEGLNGEIISRSCGRAEASAPLLWQIASDFGTRPAAARIDAGNALGASGLAALGVTHDPRGFARALSEIGLQALALGRKDLTLPRATLLKVASVLAEVGLPFIVDNLSCAPEGRALCDVTVHAGSPAWVMDTPSGKLGVLAVLSPSSLDRVARDRSAGLTLLDPVAALEAAARSARAQGAQWVVAIYGGARDGDLDEVLSLGARLAASSDRPDAMLGISLSPKLSTLTFPGPSPMPLVAVESGRALQMFPEREVLSSPMAGADPSLGPALDVVPREVRAWSEQVGTWACEAFDFPSKPWRVGRPLDPDDLAGLFLDALREETRAEVALINGGALRAPPVIEGTFSPLEMVVAVPFDNAVETTRMTGALLRSIFERDAGEGRLVVKGLRAGQGGVLLVNGRPLDDGQRYRVVTNDYLAAGGDAVILDPSLKFERVSVTARELWTQQLQRRAEAGLLVDSPILDPALFTRWVFRGSADLGFSSVRVVNPEPSIFTDAQLSRSQTVAFREDVEVRADADHPSYTWENGLRLRYGFARTTAADGVSSGLAETEDLAFLRSTAVWKKGGGPVGVTTLVPFVESYLESEVSPPPSRTYHHLEWRPIAGLRWPLLPELALFVGAGLDWEALARPDQMGLGEPVAAAVVVGGAQLRPKRIISAGRLMVDAEGSVDLAWRDPSDTSSAQLRFHSKLSIPVLETLSLTLSYDLFARHRDEGQLSEASRRTQGWGFSGDLLFGVRFLWVEPWQSLRF